MEVLPELGYKTASMALSEKARSIDDGEVKGSKKLAVLLGSESTGLSPETLSKSDYIIKIPMSHGVDSLNVAAASAVAFWELGRRPET